MSVTVLYVYLSNELSQLVCGGPKMLLCLMLVHFTSFAIFLVFADDWPSLHLFRMTRHFLTCDDTAFEQE